MAMETMAFVDIAMVPAMVLIIVCVLIYVVKAKGRRE